MKFSKPATTIDEQIERLSSRGMDIPNRDYARHYLTHLNYYRLGAYWLPFEQDHTSHTFKPGTHFDTIIDHYVFDRELRLLVMDAIERLEVSIRTQWAYQLAHLYGPHAYLDESIFKNEKDHQRCLGKLKEELKRSKEVFVSHYHSNYSEPELPPIWAVVEVMSLGQLSKWVSSLSRSRDRRAISKVYGIDDRILTSFLHHLTIIRNICAHHSRLWNRSIGLRSVLPRDPKHLNQSLNQEQPKRVYTTLVILEYMMNVISPNHHWKNKLFSLLERHPDVDISAMGFPVNWQDRTIWQMN